MKPSRLCLFPLVLLLARLTVASTASCSLVSLHNLIVRGRVEYARVVDSYNAWTSFKSNFEIIESRLAAFCDNLQDRRSTLAKFTAYLKPATYIPPLKSFISPVQQVSHRLESDVLARPQRPACELAGNVRAYIDATNKTLVPVQKALNYFLTVTVTAYDSLEAFLDAYQLPGGQSDVHCVALGGICTGLEKLVNLENSLANEMQKVDATLKSGGAVLDNLDDAISVVRRALSPIFDGPLDAIFRKIEQLLAVEVSLPIPRGSKPRGVGEIPGCCPSGYSKRGGLCYQNCRSGYATVALACVERCPSGYKDVGLACTKTKWKKKRGIRIPKIQTRKKHSYPRLGRIPATFGDRACQCRREKRYLEAGLCYNKCGRDQFANYATKFLTTCLDLRTTRVSMGDLAQHLDVFEKAKSVPALGTALKAVDRIVSEAFKAITSAINQVGNVRPPVLKVVDDIPHLNAIDALQVLIDPLVAEALRALTEEAASGPSCN